MAHHDVSCDNCQCLAELPYPPVEVADAGLDARRREHDGGGGGTHPSRLPPGAVSLGLIGVPGYGPGVPIPDRTTAPIDIDANGAIPERSPLLPELHESQATGRIAEIYDDIRRFSGVPYVSSLQR